jgi:hypothetical protein
MYPTRVQGSCTSRSQVLLAPVVRLLTVPPRAYSTALYTGNVIIYHIETGVRSLLTHTSAPPSPLLTSLVPPHTRRSSRRSR